MKSRLLLLIVGWACTSSSLLADAGRDAGRKDENWGQWRGPTGSGVSPTAKPPIEWSNTRNVRWKRELPGEGASTPIVWGDLVFVQAAIPVDGAAGKPDGQPSGQPERTRGENQGRRGDRPSDGARGGRRPPEKVYKYTILAFERKTGRQAWERVVCEQAPHEGSHGDGSFASASPMTDGRHVFAWFGSRGLHCLTPDGQIVWSKDFGDLQIKNQFGEGSSPVLHDETIVVNWDHEGDSFIVALDAASGEERWRQPRDERTSWSTPLVITDAGPAQVVVSATKRVRSYELASGRLIWECGGLGENCVPTPVAAEGLVLTMSGHREPALLAIRYGGAKGDLTGSEAVVWRLDTGTPYVPSPLLYGELVYFAQKNDAILSCHDLKTGKMHYNRQRLEDLVGLYASPVGADGRVYVVGRNGTACVLKHGPEFQVLAVNKLEDRFTASPALVGSELYLRGHKYLYCIAE